jgi:hypothetical protein
MPSKSIMGSCPFPCSLFCSLAMRWVLLVYCNMLLLSYLSVTVIKYWDNVLKRRKWLFWFTNPWLVGYIAFGPMESQYIMVGITGLEVFLKGLYVKYVIHSLWYYRKVLEPLVGEAWRKKVRSLWACPWRWYWDHKHHSVFLSLLSGHHEVNNFVLLHALPLSAISL